MTNTIYPLRAPEFQRAFKTAEIQFLKLLGDRPTRKTARKDIPERVEISLLEHAAIILLLILSVFTGLKVGAATVPLAETLATTLLHGQTAAPMFIELFKLFAVLLSVALSTSGFIYFKILDSELVEVRRELSSLYPGVARYVSLNYLGYYIPMVLSYLILVYIAGVSLVGFQTPIEFLILLLPVLAEWGSVTLVSRLLIKVEKQARKVTQRHRVLLEQFEKDVRGMESDKRFLNILQNVLWETILSVKRDVDGRKGVSVHKFLEVADGKTRTEVLLAEYARYYQSGVAFIKAAQGGAKNTAAAVQQQAQTTQQPHATMHGKFKANGGGSWTTDALYDTIVAHGLLDPIMAAKSPYYAISTYFESVPNRVKSEVVERLAKVMRK